MYIRYYNAAGREKKGVFAHKTDFSTPFDAAACSFRIAFN